MEYVSRPGALLSATLFCKKNMLHVTTNMNGTSRTLCCLDCHVIPCCIDLKVCSMQATMPRTQRSPRHLDHQHRLGISLTCQATGRMEHKGTPSQDSILHSCRHPQLEPSITIKSVRNLLTRINGSMGAQRWLLLELGALLIKATAIHREWAGNSLCPSLLQRPRRWGPNSRFRS